MPLIHFNLEFRLDIQLRQQSLVLNYILVANAQQRSSVLVQLDLSAAFGTLGHQILLARLAFLGVLGNVSS